MKSLIQFSLALLGSIVLCGVVEAQEVTYDLDRATDFSHLQTFAFKEGGAMSDNPLVNERITGSITAELVRRGMSQTDDPDVYVVTKLATEMRKEVTAYGYDGWYGPYGYGYGYGYGWYGGLYGWNGWGGPTSYEIRDVRYDTLTIDMIDARTGKLVWRGTGTREIDPGWKPDRVDRKVNKTVVKILSHFPPGWDED
jgi:hypothetical protein